MCEEYIERLKVLKSPLAFLFVGFPKFPTLVYSLLVRQMCGEFIISAFLLISQSMTSWLVYQLPQTKTMTSAFRLLSSVS